ncbi:pilus assembly protein TadG-related protein [Sphingomicrobium sp. XHP0239]|uniref:pilus assembly protein TadG-related protein n=1 Tax=Sphingomicrobium maritimum TaxID=3133972 RepID=UPI0031CC5107
MAPILGVSVFALVAAGGIAFDYARLATLDTELQSAADQAALAAATQLDGQADAIARATAAAEHLVGNDTYLADDDVGIDIEILQVRFYATQGAAEAHNGTDCPTASTTADDSAANFVCVRTVTRRANFALTPVVGSLGGNAQAMAVAGMESAICKTPPVMICNPTEPSTNTDELLGYDPARGTGLRLVTGDATVPGNFGWLEAGEGNGAPALGGNLGWNTPSGVCQSTDGVTTKTGMTASVLDAFNTRMDVYANGNSTCPTQNGGGTCSPSVNTRKDLKCDVNGANATACKNAGSWEFDAADAYDPYLPDRDGPGDDGIIYKNADGTRIYKDEGKGNKVTWRTEPNGGGTVVPGPGTANYTLRDYGAFDSYPTFMGYPHDKCHSSLRSRHTCGVQGSGQWDANAYFKVNYGGWTEAQWRTALGYNTGALASTIPARYDVYRWEIDNKSVTTPMGLRGIGVSQGGSSKKAFGIPATGAAGVDTNVATGQPDRRLITVAVLNCQALGINGHKPNVPVAEWINVFLVEPAINRGTGSNLYTDQKDIYVEYIEKTKASANAFETVVRRDKPYLVK